MNRLKEIGELRTTGKIMAPRIDDLAKEGDLAGTAGTEAFGDVGVVRRDERREHLARARERLALHRDVVLDRDRDAFERTPALPGLAAGIRGVGLSEHVSLVEMRESPDLVVHPLIAGDERFAEGTGRERAGREAAAELSGGKRVERVGHGLRFVVHDARDGDLPIARGGGDTRDGFGAEDGTWFIGAERGFVDDTGVVDRRGQVGVGERLEVTQDLVELRRVENLLLGR